MTGPQFLVLYVCLLAACVVVAGVVRHALRGPADQPSMLPTDPYQVAFLAGGYCGVIQAAVVALTSRGMVAPQPGGRVAAVPAQTTWLHPVERAVYDAVAGAPPATPSARAAAAASLADRMEEPAARPGRTAGTGRPRGGCGPGCGRSASRCPAWPSRR